MFQLIFNSFSSSPLPFLCSPKLEGPQVAFLCGFAVRLTADPCENRTSPGDGGSPGVVLGALSGDAAPLPPQSHPAAVRLGPVHVPQWAGLARKAARAGGLQPGVPSRGQAVPKPLGHSLLPVEQRVLHHLCPMAVCCLWAGSG